MTRAEDRKFQSFFSLHKISWNVGGFNQVFLVCYRHNLTLNKAFIKVPRPATEGRGAYWKLELGAETQIFRRMARNYNRPHTAVAKPMGLNSRGHKIFYCDTTDVNTVYIAVPTWLSIKIHAEEKDFIHMYYKIYLKWRFKHH